MYRSDSQIVLSWISSTKQLPAQFVRARVHKIKELTSSSSWRFRPTAATCWLRDSIPKYSTTGNSYGFMDLHGRESQKTHRLHNPQHQSTQSMHSTVMHGGVCETLTHIRQTYWIPQGRQLVRRLISKCVTRRKIQGPPFRSVPTPLYRNQEFYSQRLFNLQASITQVLFMYATKEIKLHLKFIFVAIHLCRSTSLTPRVSGWSDSPGIQEIWGHSGDSRRGVP